ncbi:4Fe-4S dicluster domain-containing protein [Dehalococcoidia bacterium]|nr:4Fe-4S dicluster domain-containing protein [Dehalococcoidia bacterium]
MKRIYIKEQVCIGCRLCEVYCQVGHSHSRDVIEAFKKESPRPLPRLVVEVRETLSLAVQCRHCAEAPCIHACLTGAQRRDPETGIVTADEEKCIGCWICIAVCPFGAIRQDTYRGRIVKCDLCTGEDMPVCVVNCPNEALLYAETEEDVLARK